MFLKPRLADPNEVKPGDIIGFVGTNAISVAISLLTCGIPFYSLSHVGIIGRWRGRTYLFESTILDDEPCAIRKQKFAGTKAKNLRDKLEHYRGKVWHYPLVRSLYSFESRRLNNFLIETLGLPYDTIGAFRAGGISWSWIESRLRDQDLHSIFCSEWVCAAHTNIGIFQTDNVSRWSPHRLVLRERRLGVLGKPRRLK